MATVKDNHGHQTVFVDSSCRFVSKAVDVVPPIDALTFYLSDLVVSARWSCQARCGQLQAELAQMKAKKQHLEED